MEPMRLLVTDAAAQPPRQATAWLIMTLGRKMKLPQISVILFTALLAGCLARSTTQSDRIDRLVDKLSDTSMWQTGLFPGISLPLDAPEHDVVAEAVRMHSFDEGRIGHYSIVTSRDVAIPAYGVSRSVMPLMVRVRAVELSTDHGGVVLLYERGTTADLLWTRIYKQD
jgi:hypothetical protein